MTNHTIDLPSKRAKIVLDIEKPLRRQFRSENHRKTQYIKYLYWFIILGTLTCTILHFLVEPRVASAASYVAPAGTLEYFCQTGVASHEIDQKALSANTRELCGV